MQIDYDMLLGAPAGLILAFGNHFGNDPDKKVDIWDFIKVLENKYDDQGYIFWLFNKFSLTGIARKWHYNCRLKHEYSYKNGCLHGICKTFSSDDAELSHGSVYKNGSIYSNSVKIDFPDSIYKELEALESSLGVSKAVAIRKAIRLANLIYRRQKQGYNIVARKSDRDIKIELLGEKT